MVTGCRTLGPPDSCVVVKRAFDVVVAALALVALAPLFLILAVLVKLDSPGPVIFASVRVAQGGKPFRLYKFRSMVVDAQSISNVLTTPTDDPRITRLGKILRRFALDELPQIANVLKGEMSFVGPRPEVPSYVALFTDEEAAVILSVRPGITDWATVWIGDKGKLVVGSADPEKIYVERIRPEKLRLQQEYVKHRTFWIDMQILAKTAGVVIARIRA